MKICPCCGNILIPKKVLAHYVRYIEVDQCEHCGGIWFDKYELYSMKPEEVEKFSIEKSIKSLCQPSICPNDKSPLMLLKDPLIPKDIVIYYCEQCFGMWLPLDSLRKYKAYQRSRKESFNKESRENLPKELEEKIDLLLKKGEEDLKKQNEFELDYKMSQFVSVVLLILKILSYFIKR
ncbi:MAG: hypothetical protein C0196_06385 [Dictyoglomus turgidum]|nr:MAG: hypothetical protein C0196_06385 [Dictyoglomus turgidum]